MFAVIGSHISSLNMSITNLTITTETLKKSEPFILELHSTLLFPPVLPKQVLLIPVKMHVHSNSTDIKL